ncbi:ATP-binding protein [Paenarthrobacter sp. PH39-S1]|uniref:sensor histidine kinase n=1 Tax=Paenarthrobacter sp. PH39-S1 TaxID=3046204 RepID=UPI0024BAD45A|nr:ATP-binding protein [Paenarthrobacter sp. PH39-S1]MDJ0355237.1 ATP-binding protein [Paenarthrobacter sp. PH39-S1]
MRKRATAAAVVAVALALLVGGITLLVLLQTSLIASTEAASRSTAADLTARIRDNGLRDAVQSLPELAHSGEYVQIIGPSDTVVGSSETASNTIPLTSLRPAAGQTLTQDVSSLQSLGDPDDFLLVATGVRLSGGVYTIVVAATVQVQVDTVTTVGWFMLGATPLLLIIVGVSVWVLVGRSLRQVERIRGQVALIDGRRLDERLDVPPTNDEIQALATTMNTMLDRLQTSDRKQRRFVSDASHELRSPLATLSASVEIASADPSGSAWLQMQDVLSGETARMRYLVDDLLTLAKADDGGLRTAAEDVDLDDILDTEVRRLRSTSGHRIVVDAVPARITGDAQRLGQVLRNVLDNADRHARAGISIKLITTPDATVVQIDNDGDPVPAADRLRIFERFVRLDESRSRESGGSGLGLAIAAGIMAAHHGTITAKETNTGHCRFELVLPPPAPP